MIRAILWDWGGVFNPQHETLNGYHTVAERYGFTPAAFYDHLYSGNAWQQARIGAMTSREYWGQIQQGLGVTGELEVFLAELFAGEVINPTLVALAEVLHARYRSGLLSNALDDLETQLADRWQVAHLFDVVINSAQVGVAKPNPRAFQLALEALDCHQDEVVFIDDKLRNIIAAQAFGISSIHYTTAPALLKALVKRKLLTEAESKRLLPRSGPEKQ